MPITKTIAAGLVALSALAAAAPAQAHSTGSPQAGLTIQFGAAAPAHFRGHHGYGRHAHWGRLSPREVRWLLRERGFHRIRFVDRGGRVYRAVATHPRGGRVALAINARTGSIIDVDRLGHRGRGHWRGRGHY